MSLQDSAFLLSFGKHSSITDVSSTPSLTHLLPEKHGFSGADYGRLQPAPFNPTNKRFPAKRGVVDVTKAIALEQILRGLQGNTGGAIASLTTSEVGGILDVVFGTAAVDPAGAATTATSAGSDGSTATLVVAERLRCPVGSVVMFQAPSGTYHVRHVRVGGSGAGALTLDRNWVGTVADGTTIVRAARWVDDPAVHEHVHAYFRGEWQGGDALDPARVFRGCMSRASLDFATGQFAKLMTSWQCTDIADVAPADTAFSEPAAGHALVCANNSFWIGNTAYYADGLKVELGGTSSPVRANSGPHGIQGYKVMKGGEAPRTRITVTLQLGVNTGEVNEALLNTLQGHDLDAGEEFVPLDVAFQVGGVAQAFGYNVMPAAVVVAADDSVVVDGRKHVAITLEATDPVNAGVTGGSSLYPYEFHLG